MVVFAAVIAAALPPELASRRGYVSPFNSRLRMGSSTKNVLSIMIFCHIFRDRPVVNSPPH